VPEPARLRQIPPHFSWVDHRLVRHGHLRRCGDLAALALYLFLVTVGDRRGLSYYSEGRLTEHLPLSVAQLRSARRRLVDTGLIAYRKPFYQVLGLEGLDRVMAAFEELEEEHPASPESSCEAAPVPKTVQKIQGPPLPLHSAEGQEPDEADQSPGAARKTLREMLDDLRSKEAAAPPARESEQMFRCKICSVNGLLRTSCLPVG
jgi:hypothetical protein